MAKLSILIIEDEEPIAELIRFNLAREGYLVTVAPSGEEALTKISSNPFNLVLLDLMLPDIDGLEVCRRIKSNQNTSSIPVIMLTAKGEDSDIVAGLELGADDYVVKPFSPKVLIARIRAVLRRKAPVAQQVETLAVHNLIIHPGRHEVTIANRKIDLSAAEFRILYFLASRPGWVFTRSQIVDGVKGDNYPVTDRSVDVAMVALRKKLGSAAEYVETVRGVGYRFKEPEGLL